MEAGFELGMMMTIKRIPFILPVIFLLYAHRSMPGQQTDLQSWYELELDYGFDNGLDLSGEIEQRFRDNFLQYDRTLLTIAADYDLLSWLRIGGGFRALLRANKEFDLKPGYRIHGDIQARQEWNQTEISLRNRLQYGFDEIRVFHEIAENKLTDRTRLRVEHRFFGTRISWYGYLESWYSLTGRSDRKFYRVRYSTGLEFMIDFRSDLSLRYILDDEINVNDPLRAHIVVIGYSYSL